MPWLAITALLAASTFLVGFPGCESRTVITSPDDETGEAFCTLDLTALDFGALSLGDSTTRTFTVSNFGEGSLIGTVSVTTPDGAPAAGAPFAVVSEAALFVGPGQSRTLEVEYTPTAEGTDEFAVTIAGVACSRIALSGQAFPPSLCVLSDPTLDFGNVAGPTVDFFTISNEGGGFVTFDLDPAGCPVTFDPASGQVAAGDSLAVMVEFRPTDSNPISCEFEVAAGCTLTVEGEGSPAFSVNPGTLTFSPTDVRAGGSAFTRSFTITNNGGFAAGGDIQLSGCASVLSITSGGGAFTLDPAESRTVFVRFAPTLLDHDEFTCEVTTGTDVDVQVSAQGRITWDHHIEPLLDNALGLVGTTRCFNCHSAGSDVFTFATTRCSNSSSCSGGQYTRCGSFADRSLLLRKPSNDFPAACGSVSHNTGGKHDCFDEDGDCYQLVLKWAQQASPED